MACANVKYDDVTLNVDKCERRLCDLLRTSRTNDKNHTHVLVGSPYGRYYIGSSKMELFWDLYIKAAGGDEPCYLAEAPGKEAPVMVDVDLKACDVDPPLYEDRHVRTMIACYQKTLESILVDVRPESLTCVVLEKPCYELAINGKKYIKNGFHLHFPKLFIDRKVQEVYLIPIVKKELNGLFDRVKCSDFIDGNSINVHWLMYGSKKPNNNPYVATRCFLAGCEETNLESGLENYALHDSVVARDDVRRYLPRILSTFLYGREDVYYYKAKPSVNTPIIDKYAARKLNRCRYDQMNVRESLKEIEELLCVISNRRADDRADWLSIGFCIWNITGGDDEGLSLWLEFSERSDKYDEVECIHVWNNMRPSHYTIGTLKFFAKQDDPDAYETICRSKGKCLVHKAIEGSHNDLAKLLFNEYGNEFVCASAESKTWYLFRNHIWTVIEKGLNLRERISHPTGIISTEFSKRLDEIHDSYPILSDAVSDDTKQHEQQQRGRGGKKKRKEDFGSDSGTAEEEKIIKKILQNCKSAPFKNNIMIECVEVFRNEVFYTSLNKDPYIVAFKNGIYDFAHDIFRDGRPEDYISIALPIDYVDYGTFDDPKIIEIDDFFCKIFPDKSVRDYFIDQVCQVFVGGNHDKVMMFWTGNGNNGKTITQTLFEKMLGRLAIKFSTSLVTGKKSQIGVAAPELARAGDGVRWAVMDEPNPDEMINAGIMKALTGNDSYWARDLYEKGKSVREIIPMFKLHMICNKLPGIKDADAATWDRVRVIPFESKFVPESQCPDDYDERVRQKRFPLDRQFGERLNDMTQPLAWYLIQKWRSYSKVERVVPDRVKIATDNYKEENDIYQQFVDANIVEKSECRLTLNVLFMRFREWFRDECPSQLLPNRTTVKYRFSSIIGEPVRGVYWEGLTIGAVESIKDVNNVDRENPNGLSLMDGYADLTRACMNMFPQK